jgi:hypothetical protein
MPESPREEGLPIARLMMVLSSISPLFILWAIRGNTVFPEIWFLSFCGIMVIGPNLFLWRRVKTAKKRRDRREIIAGHAEDHRDHLLVYLFAMLLPFYSMSIDGCRDFASILVAIAFIVFLFWHLNMHYMNIFWAFRNYRIFTITPANDNNPLSGKAPQVLISYRTHIEPGETIFAYRLSRSVFLEERAE